MAAPAAAPANVVFRRHAWHENWIVYTGGMRGLGRDETRHGSDKLAA